MRLHRAPVRRRAGYTLIELLVVMAIIAVLASLTTAGVLAAFTKLDEVRCRNDISTLASSLKTFESEYHITTPPPSRLWLDKQGSYTTVPVGFTAAQMGSLGQLGIDSQSYLRKVWPRLWAAGPVDWNGDGNPNEGFVLEGEQVLVFFLGGGRNSAGGFIGFSVDATNPMNPSAGIKRNGPWFQFQMPRVQAGPTSGFPMYYDVYSSSPPKPGDQPYAYFSSGKSSNGYSPYAVNPVLTASDCPSLVGVAANGQAAPLLPYNQPPPAAGQAVVFYNPDTFQIISAGKNKRFGPGGTWTGPNAVAIGTFGADDISNFSNRKLGINP